MSGSPIWKVLSVRLKGRKNTKDRAMRPTWITFALIHYLTVDSSFDIDILGSLAGSLRTKETLWMMWWHIYYGSTRASKMGRDGQCNNEHLASSKWGVQTANYSSFITWLQSVHGSIHTVITSYGEKAEWRGDGDNALLVQPCVNGSVRDWRKRSINIYTARAGHGIIKKKGFVDNCASYVLKKKHNF